MESKVLLDFSEYQDLLHIKKLYHDLKKGKSETSAQEGFGDVTNYAEPSSNLINQVTEKVFEKIKLILDDKKEEKPYSNTDKVKVQHREAKDNFLSKLSQRIKKRGELLYNKLLSFPDFNVDETSGEVTLGDTFYPNSDIVRLLRCVLYSHITTKSLTGKDEFVAFLSAKGLGYLIKNTNLKRKASETNCEGSKKKVQETEALREDVKPRNELENQVVKGIEMEEFKDNESKNVIDPKWYCLA